MACMSTVQSLMLMSTKGQYSEITHEVQIKINKKTCCLTKVISFMVILKTISG